MEHFLGSVPLKKPSIWPSFLSSKKCHHSFCFPVPLQPSGEDLEEEFRLSTYDRIDFFFFFFLSYPVCLKLMSFPHCMPSHPRSIPPAPQKKKKKKREREGEGGVMGGKRNA